MIALIAAYAENHVIGQNGCIPWDIPEEKHRFRDITMGHIIVMGRKTYEEIGRPLPGRETIVVSSTKNFDQPHCKTVTSLQDAFKLAGKQDVFICGGEQLYRESLPFADVLYLTEIHENFAGDAFFPGFSTDEFQQIKREDIMADIPYTFVIYRRCEMNYVQAREYIAQLTAQKGIVLGMKPIRDLLERVGNPQDTIPAVHIAGTNGKGSTLTMIACILRAAGYRVGTYASPAVFCERECWKINGEMISEQQYAHWMTILKSIRDTMNRDGLATPTAFEMETVLAFCWMAQQGCDIVVMECGMGGREDATNVLTTTVVSVLTSIGMDHMKFLGNSLQEIARAKGGIIKPNVPVVLQGQDTIVVQEISAICKQTNSELTVIHPEHIYVTQADAHGIVFDYQEDKQITVSLPGLVQARNAATAIAAVRQLKQFTITEEDIRCGLCDVVWPGRMEQICDCPVILLDGAHNPNAATRLREEVLHRYANQTIIEIAGVLADKDFTEVGRLMAPLAHKIITVTPHNTRALQAEKLADCLRQFCDDVYPADSVAQALELAVHAAGNDGVIVAFGSLSWLHELRNAVEEQL